jgi:hypothetical protein
MTYELAYSGAFTWKPGGHTTVWMSKLLTDAQNVYGEAVENTFSSIVACTARCTATEICVVVGMCLATHCLAVG